MARTVGANRQQSSKEIQHKPKISTPEWSHATVACMADGQPSALETGRHPGCETSVGLPGEHKLYVRHSHMRPEPYHDELHTFRRETERRQHCENEGWICAVAECRCRHDMSSSSRSEILIIKFQVFEDGYEPCAAAGAFLLPRPRGFLATTFSSSSSSSSSFEKSSLVFFLALVAAAENSNSEVHLGGLQS